MLAYIGLLLEFIIIILIKTLEFFYKIIKYLNYAGLSTKKMRHKN